MLEETHSMYWVVPPDPHAGILKVVIVGGTCHKCALIAAILGWGISQSIYISPTYPSIYPEISEWNVKCGVEDFKVLFLF